MIDHLAEHVSGYLVSGSVGEVSSLTLEERAALTRAAARRRPVGHTLAVSISDNAIGNSRVLSDVAGEVGADVLIEYFGAVVQFAVRRLLSTRRALDARGVSLVYESAGRP